MKINANDYDLGYSLWSMIWTYVLVKIYNFLIIWKKK